MKKDSRFNHSVSEYPPGGDRMLAMEDEILSIKWFISLFCFVFAALVPGAFAACECAPPNPAGMSCCQENSGCAENSNSPRSGCVEIKGSCGCVVQTPGAATASHVVSSTPPCAVSGPNVVATSRVPYGKVAYVAEWHHPFTKLYLLHRALLL